MRRICGKEIKVCELVGWCQWRGALRLAMVDGGAGETARGLGTQHRESRS